MGQRGGEGEAVEYLGDTGPRLVGLSLVSPVSCGQRVLQSVCDGLCLNGQLKVEVLGEEEEGKRERSCKPG